MKFKIYPVALPANGNQVIYAVGTFVRLQQFTGSVSLSVDDLGAVGPLTSGQGFRVADEFKRVVVTDLSGAANNGNLIVADGDFVDQTLLGTVSVVDGEKARTLAGGMFAGSPLQAAVAAQFACLQLWNPVGSGKNLIVTQMSVGGGAVAATVGVTWDTVQRATNLTGTRAANKLQTSAIGVGQVRAESLGANTNAWFWATTVPANTVVPWPIKGAIVVPPGKGLNAESYSANNALQANFEWFEESQ